jgi:hypothetical protein
MQRIGERELLHVRRRELVRRDDVHRLHRCVRVVVHDRRGGHRGPHDDVAARGIVRHAEVVRRLHDLWYRLSVLLRGQETRMLERVADGLDEVRVGVVERAERAEIRLTVIAHDEHGTHDRARAARREVGGIGRSGAARHRHRLGGDVPREEGGGERLGHVGHGKLLLHRGARIELHGGTHERRAGDEEHEAVVAGRGRVEVERAVGPRGARGDDLRAVVHERDGGAGDGRGGVESHDLTAERLRCGDGRGGDEDREHAGGEAKPAARAGETRHGPGVMGDATHATGREPRHAGYSGIVPRISGFVTVASSVHATREAAPSRRATGRPASGTWRRCPSRAGAG